MIKKNHPTDNNIEKDMKASKAETDVIEDDEVTEGPDWDQERWKHKAEGDDDDRPEWDEEKWQNKKEFKAKAAALYHAWWNNPRYRYGSMAALVVLLLLVSSVPTARYAFLNTVGVKKTANILVLDQETNLPLKNVLVELSSQEMQTDETGVASFKEVRLGSHELLVTKTAYDEFSKQITIGSGSDYYESVGLISIGTQFEFIVTDWLSDEPISKAEAVSGENSAFSDEEGKILLSVPPTSEDMLNVTILADNYLSKDVQIDPTSKNITKVKLVLDEPQFFVSKRDGKYDIYRIYPDSSGEELVVEGTGNEKNNIRFSISPNNDYAVLVASRSGEKNSAGYVLDEMYIMNLSSNKLQKVETSERIDLVGWIDGSIIYVKVAAGASGANPDRHKLVSRDVSTKESVVLASSNYFNDVLVARNHVYYAPSDAYRENPQPYLFKTTPDNQSAVLFSKEVWTILQRDYNNIAFDNNQDWYDLHIPTVEIGKRELPPKDFSSRIYTSSPDRSYALWTEVRDGKGVLLLHDTSLGEDRILLKRGGLRNPLRWLSDEHVVFRVVNDSETADYVTNINGGEPAKITDLSNVSGFDRWYYYY